jgi:hypothetical protein
MGENFAKGKAKAISTNNSGQKGVLPGEITEGQK